MKKTYTLMKQTLAFALTFALLLCGSTMLIFAESDAVTSAKEALAAIPDPTGITDPQSKEYTAALNAATDAIYALARCSQEELDSLDGYTKAFDAAVMLSLLPLHQNVPTGIPHKDTVMEQIDWLHYAEEQIMTLPDNLYLYAEYTTPVPDPENPEDTVSYGDLAISQAYENFSNVSVRVTAYVTTLTDEEEAALLQAVEDKYGKTPEEPGDKDLFAEEMAKYPDSFTPENIFEYANQFHYLTTYMKYGVYDTTQVDPQDLQKYITLEEEFQVVMGIHKEALIQQLEDEINRICDLEQVATYSSLRKALIEQPICEELENKISAMMYVYDMSLYEKIDNYDLYIEYYEAIFGYNFGWDDGMEGYFIYGDLNGDYEIDAVDALLVLQAAVQTAPIDDSTLTVSDVDGNGSVNAVDALYILQYAVDTIYIFPIQEILY